ncbi:MAG: pyridoxal phosphate-dependent aminotransferase [bacterium]
MLNNIYETREKYSKSENFIDLISTDLSKIYSYPVDKLNSYIKKYIDNRVYEPDSKGILKARLAISNYENSKLEGCKIEAENIFITASTSESYNLIFQTLTKSNNTKEKYEVLLPNPSYPLFEELTKYSNLDAKYYNQVRDNNWEVDLESIIKNITCKTKFIVLISPNNPTGNVINNEVFKKICSIANRNKIVIIIDEVFNEFTYENEITWDMSGIVKFEDLIIFKLNGISKMFALPDFKLAWIEIYGESTKKEELIEELEISNDMFLSANSISQNILPDLFNDIDCMKDLKNKLKTNFKIINDKLSKQSDFEYILPKAGIHLILTTKKEYSVVGKSLEEIEEIFVSKLIEKEEVFIHPGFFYDYHDQKRLSFVMSIANDTIKLTKGLDRLFKFLTTFHG